MATDTGRSRILRELPSHLDLGGWRPREAGWFTQDLCAEGVGVLALGTSVAGLPAGHCLATLHVGLHHQGVEMRVAALCGRSTTYRDRTTLTSIGYLMPDHRWRQWLVTESNATNVAAELTDAVERFAKPYLTAAVGNGDLLLAETGRSWLQGSIIEMTRHLVTAEMFGTEAQVKALLSEAHRQLDGRTDPAAHEKRALLDSIPRT